MKTLIISLGIIAANALAIGAGVEPTLKGVFKDDFLIGVALNSRQFCESNAVEATLVKNQFDSISPENVLKWKSVHPLPGKYDFAQADRYVEFGERYGMSVIGHNLVWHQQTPMWVFQDAQGQPVSREVLLQRMHDHILTVVGRYKGRIKGWDVVNEALAGDGSLNTNSPWLKIIGPDYLQKAYEFAHEADPAAGLYYNDFFLENPQKRAGAVALIQQLQSGGVKITAVGLQGHYSLTWPAEGELDATIMAFAKLGVKVMITELDVDVLPSAGEQGNADISRDFAWQKKLNPYADGLPLEVQEKLAARYASLFEVFLRHREVVSRVTFWGVNDGNSWLNYWPVRGRTNYPLLFDRNDEPKPAFAAVIRVGQGK